VSVFSVAEPFLEGMKPAVNVIPRVIDAKFSEANDIDWTVIIYLASPHFTFMI
jgi:hypothetical protein